MKENGNTHKQHDCPFCWRVLYSKGALTNHLNNEHWDTLEQDEEPQRDSIIDIAAKELAAEMSAYNDREVIDMIDERFGY